MILSPRTMDTIELNIGNVLIFCEGHTEENYFNFFKDRIENKYDNIEIQTEVVESNARAVLNYADKFLKEETNTAKYKNYDKYLVFDCDAPSNINDVISDAEQSTNEYILLISNLMFEVWLLMHMEEITDKPLRKSEILRKMEYHLKLLPKEYDNHKDDAGIIAKIIIGYQNVDNAIRNAKELREKYNSVNIENILQDKLPYSNVDELVKQLAKAASY